MHVDPRTLQLVVSDLQGRTIVADSPDGMRFEGRGFTLRKSLPIGEHIYGLGDKTGALDRRGETFVDWNTDAFGFAPSTDPIYKSIPFYIGVGRAAPATACSSTTAGASGSISATATQPRSRSARLTGRSIIM